jgi:hypothetical protein
MKNPPKVILRILITILFTGTVLLFLFQFFTSIPAGGVGAKPSAPLSVSFLLFLGLFLGFIYKSLTGDKSFLIFSIALIILFLLYLLVAVILLSTNFCPSYFNFMPELVSTAEKNPPIPIQETMQKLFCPFSERAY